MRSSVFRSEMCHDRVLSECFCDKGVTSECYLSHGEFPNRHLAEAQRSAGNEYATLKGVQDVNGQ